MTEHDRLWYPGPTEVSEPVLRAMSGAMIGHRGSDFPVLYKRIVEKLRTLLETKGRIFLVTSSATGVMEASVRNCAAKRVLSATCGAFSERWAEIAKANGKEVDVLAVEWGKAIKPEQVDAALSKGKYDALTLVHNETSTGVMNPLEEISQVMRKYPDVCFLVDAVSSMAGVRIAPEAWGIDVCLAGTQKCFALPPGLTVAYVSEKALRRASEVQNRGAYIDFVEYAKFDDKGQTPTTPSISHLYALDAQMDRMVKEGIPNRFKRHQAMAERSRAWAKEHFDLYAERGYESVTLTTILNNKGTDIASLLKTLKSKHHVSMGDGYGKLKEKTFRIGHMGDWTPADLTQLLGWMDEALGFGK
ncbi:MAG: alanine--glyoxylate aminotransferase family protein [Planctomycetes bacterium]|nr:alanine--glyoxylate aminotransferase family protein [Planctomycetota bacterium]